jgi:hypothetical protein
MKELMVPVERAVRPVRATAARKRRMRQELLAHLTGLFEEERARGGDQATAVSRAVERFGDPTNLGRELQDSVPLPEVFFVRLFLRKPGERKKAHALRLAALSAVLVFAVFQLSRVGRAVAGDDASFARTTLACTGVVAGYAFLGVLLGYRICQELAGHSGIASLARAAAFALLCTVATVGLVAAESVVQPENPLWWFLLRHPANPLAMGALFWLAFQPLAITAAVTWVERTNRQRDQASGDWASLEIGD